MAYQMLMELSGGLRYTQDQGYGKKVNSFGVSGLRARRGEGEGGGAPGESAWAFIEDFAC